MLYLCPLFMYGTTVLVSQIKEA